MTLRLEDVVHPTASPEVRLRRSSVLRVLTRTAILTGGCFLAADGLLGLLAFEALRQGRWLALLLWAFAMVAVYLGCGLTLCAAFVNRLRLWGGAPLGQVVKAKAHFVTWWPWAGARLLLVLLFHEATGRGGAPASRPL
jgi:hypothetical protein